MDYTEYIQKLSFRFYKPMTFPKAFTRISSILRYFHISLEVVNTRLPDHAHDTQTKLSQLLTIPRMSTFAIGALLNEGVAQLPDNASFINVGVWNGFTFLAGLKDNPDRTCVGIDNFSEFDGPGAAMKARFQQYKSSQHAFYEMDYVDYFEKIHEGKIGIYLYDGEHS